MNGVLAALDLALSLASRWQAASSLVAKAQSEGRDLTAAELNSLVAADDTARQGLVDAIAAAKSKGR